MKKIVLAVGLAALCLALTATAAEARPTGTHAVYARGRLVAAGRHAGYSRGRVVGARHFARAAYPRPQYRPWARPHRR